MDLSTSLAFFSFAFVIALGAVPIIIRYARQMNIVEENDIRKTHKEKVSNLGGIGILLATAIPTLFLIETDLHNPVMAFFCIIPLFVVSLLDDIHDIGITIRLLTQIFLGITLYEMGLQILPMEGFWMLHVSANVFFIIVMVNAYNFIDGINGLAGTLGLTGSLVLGTLLLQQGIVPAAMYSFALSGALIGYLCFNFGHKAKIFMGDNGSTMIGFSLAVLVMILVKDGKAASSQLNLAMIASIIAIPVIDIFKVASFRLLRLQSPFNADRTHIHHLLVDNGLTQPATCAVLLGWCVSSLLLAFYLPALFTSPALLGILVAPYFIIKIIVVTKRLTTSTSSPQESESPALNRLTAN